MPGISNRSLDLVCQVIHIDILKRIFSGVLSGIMISVIVLDLDGSGDSLRTEGPFVPSTTVGDYLWDEVNLVCIHDAG
jgi:hypothetical protein